MSMFDAENVPAWSERAPVPVSDIDTALTSQLVVAWAGEAGEDRRLAWWECDLVSEFGGKDLFSRLFPSSWRWAVLQGARETARRKDTELRQRDHNPDRLVSLFSLGFELDERIEERFQDLKRTGRAPDDALPGLAIVSADWDPGVFWDWVIDHGEADATASPVGRRLKGDPPSSLDLRTRKLVAGLAPAAESYPLPHFVRTS